MHRYAPVIIGRLSGDSMPDFVIRANSGIVASGCEQNQIKVGAANSVYKSDPLKVAVLGRLWNRAAFLPKLTAKNMHDAEIVAHAYQTKGWRVFAQTEGVTILLLDCTRRSLYLFRDWAGYNTFYYADNSNHFAAANLKKLMGRAKSEPKELGAGWCLKFTPERGVKLKQFRAIPVRKSAASFATACKKVRALMDEAIEQRRVSGKSGLLLSGGVDSTILAYLLKTHNVPFEAYTVSLRKPMLPVKGDGFDLYAARRAAQALNIPLNEVLLNEDRLPAEIEDAIFDSETSRITLVDEMWGMQFLARRLAREKLAVAYSGEGADAIFGGFLFFLRFVNPKDLPSHSRRAVEKLPVGLSVAQKVFHAAAGIDVIFPYCYMPLVTYALSLPIDYRIDKARLMKTVLRTAFQGEIPNEFLYREKGITRDTTHMRYALEKYFGTSRYRYISLYKKLFRG